MAKETCLNVLRALGFTVILRLASKRDRTKEIAKRSAMRAKARAEKEAAKARQEALCTKPNDLCSRHVVKSSALSPRYHLTH